MDARSGALLRNRFAISARYIYKDDGGFIVLQDRADHTYEPFSYTEPTTGRTVTLFTRPTRIPSTTFLRMTTSTFAGTTSRYSRLGRSRTRTSPADVADVGAKHGEHRERLLRDRGLRGGQREQQPQLPRQSLQRGGPDVRQDMAVQAARHYQLPWRFYFSGDFRWLSGRAWTPVSSSFFIPGLHRHDDLRQLHGSAGGEGSERWESSKLLESPAGEGFRAREGRGDRGDGGRHQRPQRRLPHGGLQLPERRLPVRAGECLWKTPAGSEAQAGPLRTPLFVLTALEHRPSPLVFGLGRCLVN